MHFQVAFERLCIIIFTNRFGQFVLSSWSSTRKRTFTQLGTSSWKESVSADLRPDRVRTADDRLTMSLRYDGQLPTFIECINRHSLYCILKVVTFLLDHVMVN